MPSGGCATPGDGSCGNKNYFVNKIINLIIILTTIFKLVIVKNVTIKKFNAVILPKFNYTYLHIDKN